MTEPDNSNDGPTVEEFRDLGPTSWLQPIKTPHSNIVLKGPPDSEDIGDLDIELAFELQQKAIYSVSAWELTDEQRAFIAAGAHLSMAVGIHPIPPLSLSIEPPFCPDDDTMMVFVKSEGEFACPTCDPRFARLRGEDNGAVRLTEDTGGQHGEDDRDASRRALDEAHRDFSPADGGSDAQGDG